MRQYTRSELCPSQVYMQLAIPNYLCHLSLIISFFLLTGLFLAHHLPFSPGQMAHDGWWQLKNSSVSPQPSPTTTGKIVIDFHEECEQDLIEW